MQMPKVAVLTPTFRRDPKVVERCILSVAWQDYEGEITHHICSDGEDEPRIRALIADRFAVSRLGLSTVYHHTETRGNSFGASVRQHLLEHSDVAGADYVVALDDDNALLPHYVRTMVGALEANKDKGFAICRIVHMGPLPSHLGSPPAVLTGIPPVCRNIDTLQVMARTGLMTEVGWVAKSASDGGYFNDGMTYERLGAASAYVEVPEVLAIHL